VSNTGEFTMSGVEKLVISTTHAGSSAGADVVDLKNVTGLTTLALASDTTNANNVTVNNLAAGVIVAMGNGSVEQIGTATLNLVSVTGTADALTVKLVDTDTDTTADTIAADGIESLTLELIGDGTSSSGEDHKIAITNTNANAATLNVVGTDDDTTLTLSGVASSITTINASTFKSALTVDTGAIGTAAMTITGGEGSDTIGMKNAASVLDGGTKASDNDTLNISFSGTGGALIVDLSSSTDQVQMFNGLANAAAQKNFESVNASAYVQTNSVGADITGSTGANTIVGTAYADTIRAGEGADTVTGGASDDSIVLTETTAAADKVVFTSVRAASATNNDGADTITGFGVGDTLVFTNTSLLSHVKGGVATGTALDNSGTDSTSATFGQGGAYAKIDFTVSGGITTVTIDMDSDGTDTSYLVIKLVGTYTDLTKWVVAADGLTWNG
jgi:hypothetical protein